jgi:hypothetical protein
MNVTSLMRQPATPMDHTAEALAHVQQLHDDLHNAKIDNDALRAELQREQDRVAFLLVEVERERSNGLVYRDLVIQLATQMDSIGEMTLTANGIVKKVRELTAPKAEGEVQGE